MRKNSHGFVIAAIVAAFMLSACNTVAGVGRDLTSLGDAMTNAAEKEKKDQHAAPPAPASNPTHPH